MIIIVSALIPPEYSGAGNRMFNYFNFLVAENKDVLLITNTKRDNKANILVIKKNIFFNRPKILTFGFELIYFFCQLFLHIKKFHKRNQKNVVWLTSTNTLTFVSSIYFKLLRYEIITQNTLVGSDDPMHKYKNDFLGLKFKLKKIQYKLSDKVTSISPALFNISKALNKNIVLIPNPVKDKFFNILKDIDTFRIINILIIGVLSYRKGTDIVLDVIEIIHSIRPEVHFTFIGPETTSDKELLKKINVFKSRNSNFVKFLGFQEDITPFLENSTIFFNPSRREGFGSMFIEAMASGTPVVAKKINEITDYIFSEKYFSVIDSEKPEIFAKEIFNIINNKNIYFFLSELGKQEAERFRENKIFGMYNNLMNI